MSVTGLNGNAPGSGGFLSFNSLPPRLHVTAEPDTEEEFDVKIMQYWRDEGFDVTYLPYGQGGRPFVEQLKLLADDLELGENYGIVAYGDAASVVLDVATKPMPHLCALVCYYPTAINHPNSKYPTQLNLTVHLATSQGFAPTFNYFMYEGVDAGFAEHDCDEFDPVSADLAWSRSMAAVNKGFKRESSADRLRERYQLAQRHRDPTAAAQLCAPDADVVNLPTLTGATGQRLLFRFYRDFFMPGRPATFTSRLISRTVGADRVVDEMLVSFKHDREVPWILPNVPPTNKAVEIPIVSIVAVRGGKLAHEHVYWDQASVLVQVGLLDPDIVPARLKKQGLQKLPVVGVEAARRLKDPSVDTNALLPKWKQGIEQERSMSVRGDRRSSVQTNGNGNAGNSKTPTGPDKR